MFLYACHILGWTALLARAGPTQAHRFYGQRGEISNCWSPKQDPGPSRSPGARELFAQSPETRIKGMLASWKGSAISYAGQETCFYLITCPAFVWCPKGNCITARTCQFTLQTPLWVLNPALEPVRCSSTQHGALRQASPISTPVPNRSYIRKSLWQTNRKEETWEVQQISYCVVQLVRLHARGWGCTPTASSEALVCSSRGTDWDRQGPYHFTTIHPLQASISSCAMTWCSTLKTQQHKCHIHASTEEHQQITLGGRQRRKCSPWFSTF